VDDAPVSSSAFALRFVVPIEPPTGEELAAKTDPNPEILEASDVQRSRRVPLAIWFALGALLGIVAIVLLLWK
jgi:hypothetical protein